MTQQQVGRPVTDFEEVVEQVDCCHSIPFFRGSDELTPPPSINIINHIVCIDGPLMDHILSMDYLLMDHIDRIDGSLLDYPEYKHGLLIDHSNRNDGQLMDHIL